ncbi:putative cytoplasmic protein [Salmonella enterica subsp. enterica]|uniref:Putative cytoplasmic protein n=1 Tax=Salmonella enterica I TaxID=59201 RepID=A0A447MSK6_SALET|nr:putative cytoplasmic protein [Salmonella enterica subsp. enterica]
MSHLEEVSARVDAAIAESVIAHMNELLIALSDDAELRREDRYVQQQRFAHGYRASRQTISRRSGRAPRTAHQRRHDPVTH